MVNVFIQCIKENISMKGGRVYDTPYYNISMVLDNYLVKAIANDRDLNLNNKKSSFIKRLFKKN